jgi:hypothetical protein
MRPYRKFWVVMVAVWMLPCWAAADELPREIMDTMAFMGLRPGLHTKAITITRDLSTGNTSRLDVESRVLSPTMKDGIQLLPVSGGTSTVFFLVDAMGIWRAATETKELGFRWEEPRGQRPILRVGSKWSVRYRAVPSDNWFTEEGEIVGQEDVEVRAGRFTGCLKSKVVSYSESTLSGKFRRYDSIDWKCRGVGVVRSEATSWNITVTPAQKLGTSVYQLTAFSPVSPDVAVELWTPERRLRDVARRYGGDPKSLVACTELDRNAVAREGKVVMLRVVYDSMLERNRGLFTSGDVGDQCGVVASGIAPQTADSKAQWVLLFGRVEGRLTIPGRFGARPIPHIRFVGVHVCEDSQCAEFFGDR